MTEGRLEHVNITVSDPDATAKWLTEVFGWHIRWDGGAIHDGRSIHVGNDRDYLAVYSGTTPEQPDGTSYERLGGLNHVGVVVDDLDATLDRVRAQGFATHSHADYEPGRRFYFHDRDGIEFEVVSDP